MPSRLPSTVEPAPTLPTAHGRGHRRGPALTACSRACRLHSTLSLAPVKNKGSERPAITLALRGLGNLHVLGRLIARIFFTALFLFPTLFKLPKLIMMRLFKPYLKSLILMISVLWGSFLPL